jgi:hypothetical protein
VMHPLNNTAGDLIRTTDGLTIELIEFIEPGQPGEKWLGTTLLGELVEVGGMPTADETVKWVHCDTFGRDIWTRKQLRMFPRPLGKNWKAFVDRHLKAEMALVRDLLEADV